MLNEFVRSESGAVTVDWVILIAAIVGLGIAVMTSVSDPQDPTEATQSE